MTHVYSFFYKSHEVLVLPPHNIEIFQCNGMTCGVEMVIYWGRGLKMLLEPLPECFWAFSYIFLITFLPFTFESVNDTTLLSYRIFVFGCHQGF